VIVPPTFVLDTLGELASRGWSANRLGQAANYLSGVGFRVMEAPTPEVAHWLARGVGASVTRYAALASWLDLPIAVSGEELRRSLRALPMAD
jgi:hypothetical protein